MGYEAALQRDYPVVFGTLYAFGLMGLVIGIVSDLMYVRRPSHRLSEDGVMRLSPLNQRRWRNFKANRRAYWSQHLRGAGLLSAVRGMNDKPIVVGHRGDLGLIYRFYPETAFGGDFKTEATATRKCSA